MFKENLTEYVSGHSTHFKHNLEMTHVMYRLKINYFLILNSLSLRRFCHLKPDNISTYLVPTKPVESKVNLKLLPPKTQIDPTSIALLERLSLVDCANKQGIQILEDAIEFADQILQVNTTGVEPLITVLEDRPLKTREDIVTEGNIRDDILSNAGLVEEDYLVAPPGNIPIEDRENLLYEDIKSELKDVKKI